MESVNFTIPYEEEEKMQPMPQDPATLLYRLEELERRLHQTVNDTVQNKEYVIQIKFIQDSMTRNEMALNRIEQEVIKHSQQLNDFRLQSQQLDAGQKQALANLQIRIFYGLCFIIASIVIGIGVWYFTHPF